MCQISAARFPGDAAAPQRARAFCSARLAGILPDSADASVLVDDCLVVVSELVSNAIRAGCTEVDVVLDIHRHRLRIAAGDDAPGEPQPVAAGPRDNHGRGLAVVEHLSRAWGVQKSLSGKQVWADLAIPAGLTLTLECSE